MNLKQYYVSSLWDKQWTPVSDELKSEIQQSELTLIKEDKDASVYRFNSVGNNYTIMYCTPEYVSYVNHITDFSYRVEVMINGVYVLSRNHQEQALIQYVLTKQPKIEVPHPNGGMFRATFSTLDDDHYQYVTEDDQIIHMRRIAIL
jgi:hypothetical protein